MIAFTLFHVLLSLAGIVAGFVVFADFLAARFRGGWTATFLVTTGATSVTGFLFPIHGFTPALGLGGLSLVVLAVAVYALRARRLAGRWRGVYVVTALLAQYFNVFVLVVQSFQKIPALHALAPTQQEPPFAIAQGLVLVGFLVFGVRAVRRFKPAAPAADPVS